MKRRRFIGLVSLGSISIGTIGYFTFGDFLKTVRHILIADTEKLIIEEDCINRFMQDALKEGFFSQFSKAKRVLIIMHYHMEFLGNLIPFKNKYYQYRSTIVGQFFLSTDLFMSRNDVQKKINYIAYFNPYKRPCANIFSDIYYPNTLI